MGETTLVQSGISSYHITSHHIASHRIISCRFIHYSAPPRPWHQLDRRGKRVFVSRSPCACVHACMVEGSCMAGGREREREISIVDALARHVASCCIALHRITLYDVPLLCFAVHNIVLHCMAWHCRGEGAWGRGRTWVHIISTSKSDGVGVGWAELCSVC